MNSTNGVIPALTGIRAICVYFIFFKHLNFFSPQYQPNLYLFVNQFFSFLNFFFVLSGFVIYYKYGNIGNLDKTKLYNYFINRVSRVFPILFILVSITFLIAYLYKYSSGEETIKLYILNITLLKGFSSKYLLTGIGPSWSLSVEELFYLLAPFIFLYATNLSSLIKIVLTSHATGLLITIIFVLFPIAGYFDSLYFTAYFTFFGRAFEFACGIFLGMIVKGKLPDPFLKKLGNRTLYLGLFIIGLSLTLLYLIAQHFKIMTAVDTWQGLIVNNLLLPVGITLFFYNMIYHNNLLQRFLASRLMVELGNATYSFYLLHTTFVLTLITKYVSHNVFIVFFIMIIVSVVFYKTIEQPIAIYLRRKLSLKRKLASAQPI